MFYQARWYDPGISEFTSPDTLIPDLYNPLDWNRYSYTRYNPVKFTDPTGHTVACDKDDWACQHHWDEPITYDTKDYEIPLTDKQKKVVDFLLNASEFVATTAFEPLDWIMMAGYCAEGDCSPWMLVGLLPLIPGSAGSHVDDIIEAGGEAGFASFRQLKKFLGDAGDGMEWHHIVEQIQIKKSGFSPQDIQNPLNVISVDAATHRRISGFYSSNIAGPGTQRVRDWLAGQSFEAQYKFGIQVLKDFGVIP